MNHIHLQFTPQITLVRVVLENIITIVVNVVTCVGIQTGNQSYTAIFYPNPTSDLLYYTISGVKNKPIKLSTVNLTGQVLASKLLVPSSSSLNGTIDLSMLPAGIYLLKLESDEVVYTTRILVE